MGSLLFFLFNYLIFRHYDLGYPSELAEKEFGEIISSYATIQNYS